MPKYIGEAGYQHGSGESLGILMVNLGTPDAPTPKAVRRYLAEFLWDPRVIEVPRPIWWLILHGVILRIRPRRSAEAYAKVWTDRGSPLMDWSVRQRKALQKELDSTLAAPVHVALGMRYGKPSVAAALEELRAKKVRRLLVLPMYPQYSATTTATVFDAVSDALKRWRWIPELRFVSEYAGEPGYIAALAASVREHWATHGRGEHLLMSFHGVPRRYLLAGDPYHCQCQKTGRLVAEALELGQDDWTLSFQSLVGREQWLQPYTDITVTKLGESGMTRLDVACPGFSTDCLETLEEIAMQNAEFFTEAGGGSLHYVPALNARSDHIECLAGLVERHVAGWTTAVEDADAKARALAMGASV